MFDNEIESVKPKKQHRVLWAVLIAAAVVILAAVFVVIRIFTTAINPISRTALALVGLRDISGGNVTVTYSGGRELRMELGFQLGSDLKTSTFDGRMSGLRAVADSGELAADVGGVLMYLDDIYELLEEPVNSAIGLDLELNRLVKDGKVNYGYLGSLAKGSGGKKELLLDFVLRECGKKNVQSGFLSGYAKDGETTQYTLDIGAFKAAFESFLKRSEESGSEAVRRAAVDLLKSGLLSQETEGSVRVSYTVTENLAARWEFVLDHETITVELNNFNEPELDMEEIRAFVDNAENKSSRLANMLAEQILKKDSEKYDLKDLFGRFFGQNTKQE